MYREEHVTRSFVTELPSLSILTLWHNSVIQSYGPLCMCDCLWVKCWGCGSVLLTLKRSRTTATPKQHFFISLVRNDFCLTQIWELFSCWTCSQGVTSYQCELYYLFSKSALNYFLCLAPCGLLGLWAVHNDFFGHQVHCNHLNKTDT